MLPYVTFFVLLAIALLHSGLGEQAILRPLFARPWELDIPRAPAEKILRFAWHLTSIAWVGLAFVAVGASALGVVAGVCLLSAVVILLMLRGHLAWPLFAIAGGAAWAASGAAPQWLWQGVCGIAATLAVAVAGLHVYWAAGGRVGFAAASPPTPKGRTPFTPGPISCLAVTLACMCLAGLLVWPAIFAWPVSLGVWPTAARVVAAALLALRAVGDGRSVGFSKREHESRFARGDDALYTPLVVVLLLGVLATWLVAN